MRWYHYAKILSVIIGIEIGLYFIVISGNTPLAIDIATILGPIIAFLGLGAIFWQLRDTARQARRVRAYEMSDRYSKEMYNLSHELKLFFDNEQESREDKWNRIYNATTYEDKQLREKVINYFGFFEDLGAMWNLKLIDHSIIMRLLPLIIERAYKRSEWYIDQWRRLEDEDIYKEWENMTREVKKIAPRSYEKNA